MIHDAARERIMELIEDARSKGAEVLAGGEADGNVISPTVLSGVTPEINAISTIIVAITALAILVAWRLGGLRGRQRGLA